MDPPHLDVWRLLLPPLLQLLDTGLHEGQAAPRRKGPSKAERLNQRAHRCGGQWETPGEWERAPPRQRQNPHGQSKGNLNLVTLEARRRLCRATLNMPLIIHI